MKTYNYTIAVKHKQKVRIPYLLLEFRGYTGLLAFLMGLILSVALFWSLLNKVFGSSNAFFLSLLFGLVTVIVTNTLLGNKDKESQETWLIDLYFKSIKKYNIIIDENNDKHYLPPKRKEAAMRCIKH